jgi:hypothetical protein
LSPPRWAPLGEPRYPNAHPHTDAWGDLALIHNGIIENFAELKAELAEAGHTFGSQTDTEVLARLIGDCYEGASDLAGAVRAALRRAHGAFAIAVVLSAGTTQKHHASTTERGVSNLSVAGLRRRLAVAEWDRGNVDVARAHLDEGLRSLIGHEPSSVTADLLHAKVVMLGRLGEYYEASATAKDLVALAGRLGSHRVRAKAHLAQAVTQTMRWDLEAGVKEAEQGLAAAADREEAQSQGVEHHHRLAQARDQPVAEEHGHESKWTTFHSRLVPIDNGQQEVCPGVERSALVGRSRTRFQVTPQHRRNVVD